MNRVAVVDASALAAIVFGEPQAKHVVRRLGADRLAAPALLGFELANVYVQKVKKYPAERDRLRTRLSRVADLGITDVQVDVTEAAELAVACNLTAYDAAYLWVARSLGARLVTLDRGLARAARRLRVSAE